GLYEFEVSTELVNRLNVAYRMGTKKLYTFAELAYRWDHNLWMPGAGLGTQIPLPKGWGVNVEGASSHVLSGDSWKLDGINMLAHARVSASKQLTKHFAVFAGPTFHVYCTDHTSSSSVDFPAPYHIFSFKDKHTTTKGWVGFSAGIRIN
ncbi:MAG: hypothetical protein LBO71_01380, partial [Prevotellaceae bacterium]|nr:hypothetical protein [Prevotellaceae bacterium]